MHPSSPGVLTLRTMVRYQYQWNLSVQVGKHGTPCYFIYQQTFAFQGRWHISTSTMKEGSRSYKMYLGNYFTKFLRHVYAVN